MPLTKKGKKIKKSFKEQYGKDADKVFYASANKGTLKGVIKKSKGGGFDYEGDAYGTSPASSYSQTDTGDLGSESANVAANRKARSITRSGGSSGNGGVRVSTPSVISVVGKQLFDVSGLGLAYEGAKKAVSKVKQLATPKIQKDVSSAALSGSQIFQVPTKRTPPTPGGGEDNGSSPIQPILKKPIKKQTQQSFNTSSFFPFQAYKSGGVRFGPPPKRGPNPLVPPVKMKTGGRGSCPHRPDGIKGVGKAIKGFKFIGVK